MGDSLKTTHLSASRTQRFLLVPENSNPTTPHPWSFPASQPCPSHSLPKSRLRRCLRYGLQVWLFRGNRICRDSINSNSNDRSVISEDSYNSDLNEDNVGGDFGAHLDEILEDGSRTGADGEKGGVDQEWMSRLVIKVLMACPNPATVQSCDYEGRKKTLNTYWEDMVKAISYSH
jgi:hypothetical protein